MWVRRDRVRLRGITRVPPRTARRPAEDDRRAGRGGMERTEPLTSTAPRPVGRTVFNQGSAGPGLPALGGGPGARGPPAPGRHPSRRPRRPQLRRADPVPHAPHRRPRLARPALRRVVPGDERPARPTDEQGRRGVVFRSLEADRLLPVLAARWVAGLPYTWARMTVEREGDRITYASRRRWPGPSGAHSRIELRVGARLEDPGPLASFLTARWDCTSGPAAAPRTGPTSTRSGRCTKRNSWPATRT